MAEKPETSLIKNIRDFLSIHGAVSTRVNAGLTVFKAQNGQARRVIKGAEPGTSDIIGCYRGRYFAIEAKVYPNKPTEEQERFLDDVWRAGGIAFVAYSIDDVQECLIDFVQDLEAENEFS